MPTLIFTLTFLNEKNKVLQDVKKSTGGGIPFSILPG